MSKQKIDQGQYDENPSVWSAGGVVIKRTSEKYEVLLCVRNAQDLIALPKGKPNYGEDEIAAAIREVREETGIEVKIVQKVSEIFYSFINFGITINKKVTFFLMEMISGNINDHDGEFDKVYWEKAEEALKMLTYQGERDVLEKAIKLVQNTG